MYVYIYIYTYINVGGPVFFLLIALEGRNKTPPPPLPGTCTSNLQAHHEILPASRQLVVHSAMDRLHTVVRYAHHHAHLLGSRGPPGLLVHALAPVPRVHLGYRRNKPKTAIHLLLRMAGPRLRHHSSTRILPALGPLALRATARDRR